MATGHPCSDTLTSTNMRLRLEPVLNIDEGTSVHVQAGEPLAHAVLIARQLRRPSLEISPDHSRLSRDARKGLAEWEEQHASDHQAYKRLARSHHGRIDS